MAGVLAARMKSGAPPDAVEMAELGAMLDRGLNDARLLSQTLQAVPSGPDGLMRALDRLARTTATQLPCSFDCEDAVFVADPHTAIAIFMIAREAVKNAVAHSRAASMRVSLAHLDEGSALVVSDDGIGFEAISATSKITGFEIMRCHAAAIGAAFECRSAPGEGTTITCRWAAPARDTRDR